MSRIMSPVPDVNGYITLLKDTGPASRINGPCKQLALRVLERMGLSLFSFKTP
jgi:chromosome partitioning protein